MLNINTVLSKLNAGHADITKTNLDLFYFSDDISEIIDCNCDVARVNSIVQHPDGEILLAGEGFSGLSDGGCCFSQISKISRDNIANEEFSTILLDSSVFTLGVQSNGKILAGGYFAAYKHLEDPSWTNFTSDFIARFNSDGSFDSTFDTNVGNIFGNVINKILVLSDDSILVCGRFSYCDGNCTKILKLNSNGTLNSTFTNNTLANNLSVDAFFDMAVDSDGNIIVVGPDGIYKLNSDGTINESFTSPSITMEECCYDLFIKTVAVQSDDKILIGGMFDTVDSNYAQGICRLNTDGSYDETFVLSGSGLEYYYEGDDFFYYGYISKIKVQEDDKILVAGDYNSYNKQTRRYLCRLEANGSLDKNFGNQNDFYNDNSWNDPSEIDNWDYYTSVCDINIISSNEIWVGGYFIKPNKYYVRLDGMGKPTDIGGSYVLRTTGINNSNFDMYDDGNFFNTNLTQEYSSITEDDVSYYDSIPSTHSAMLVDNAFDFQDGKKYAYKPSRFDGAVSNGDDYFGTDSQYFTNMYPGMFVLAATGIDITEFSITGDIGADGDGDVNAGSLFIDSGDGYTVFYKTVSKGGSNETSPTHLIIIPGSGDGIAHSYDMSASYDDDAISGLEGIDEIYVLVISKRNGCLFSTKEIEKIAQKFLDTITESVMASETSCFVCKTRTTSCVKWKYFSPNCRTGTFGCSNSGAYVPAITVCGQRLL